MAGKSDKPKTAVSLVPQSKLQLQSCMMGLFNKLCKKLLQYFHIWTEK